MALGRVAVVGSGLLLVSAVLGACSGPSGPGPVPPQADYVVEGKVRLPPGSPLHLSSLQVMSPVTATTPGADGSFAVEAGSDGLNLLALVDQGGKLMLMGFLGTREDDAELSARSTAGALLYMALGGQFQETWVQELMFDALPTEPEVAVLGAELGGMLAADPGALADGSDELVNAVLAARDRIAARSSAANGGAGGGVPLAVAWLQAQADKNYVVITDPHEEAGLEPLLADSGTGIYVKNAKRRPARFFLYQTAVKVGDGPVTQLGAVPVDPVLAVPPSHSLEFAASLWAVASGDILNAPLAPSYSEPVDLPLAPGTTRTYYTVVGLAPSFSPELPPIFTDPRFFGYREQWDQALLELDFEVFWTNVLLPVIAQFGLGMALSKVNYEAVRSTALKVMGLTLPVLAPIGIQDPLTGDRARALARVIEEAALGRDTFYYWSVIDHARAVLDAAARPPASGFDPRSFAKAIASAGGVMKVVAAVLKSADLLAVIADMTANPQGASWEAIRTEVSAKLMPKEGQVSRLAPSTEFDVIVDAPLDGGSYVYRWSTSGDYGYLYDYVGQEGKSLETTRSRVLYMANQPTAITEALRDTIKVEVYRDDGSGKVAPGAPLVAQATGTVIGKEKQDLFRGRWFYERHEFADAYDNPRVCQAIYLAITLVPGAKEYLAVGSNFFDPYKFGGTLSVPYTTGYVPPAVDPAQNPCPAQRLADGEYQELLTGSWGPPPGDDMVYFRSRFEGMIVEVNVTY